jgi:predicted DNA-binding transcriptional regulator AlpA
MPEKFSLLTESDLNDLLIRAARAGAQEFAATFKNASLPSSGGDVKLITMKGLCEELQLSRARINQLIKAGTLKPERLPGSRRLFFRRSVIDKAMEKNGKQRGSVNYRKSAEEK